MAKKQEYSSKSPKSESRNFSDYKSEATNKSNQIGQQNSVDASTDKENKKINENYYKNCR